MFTDKCKEIKINVTSLVTFIFCKLTFNSKIYYLVSEEGKVICYVWLFCF